MSQPETKTKFKIHHTQHDTDLGVLGGQQESVV